MKTVELRLNFEFDEEADTAYLYLREIKDAEVKRTLQAFGLLDVNLDLDAENRIIGIEIMNARKRLPEALTS